MSDGLTFVFTAFGKFFTLLEFKFLGIPLFVYLVFSFVMTMLAKFVVGKR